MLSEVGGSCTYDAMIKMFEAKMSGGPNDPDDLIVDAFKAYDEGVEEKIKGVMVKRHIIDAENFRHILTVFGDKFNEEEMEEIWDEFDFDDDKNVLTKSVVDMFVPGPWMRRKKRKRRRKRPRRLLPQQMMVARRRKRRRRRLPSKCQQQIKWMKIHIMQYL